LRHSTFGFHILSAVPRLVLPARLSVILRTRSSAHSFTPFASPLPPAAPRDVSVPFARLPSASFLRLWRFLSIDITGTRSREPRNSERANNSCDFSTGCFCTSATPSSCHSADSSPRGRRRRTTDRRQRRILRSRKRKGEMREIILGMVSARAADTSIIERISSSPRSRSKNGDRSLRGDVLLTPDCV
jgi:hypothetical protein